MVDLSTSYLGFRLAHPVVPSASPLSADVDTLHALVEAGAPMVVLPSLFEEQIEHEAMAIHHSVEFGAGASPEAIGGYFPEMDEYNAGPVDYLGLVQAAKRELGVPVVASLNGSSGGGWTLYSKILEDAGVDALELNISFVPADVGTSGTQVENQYLRLAEQVRAEVSIPLAVKIGPWFSSPANIARRFDDAGVNALVLFNRFYQPDIDLDRLALDHRLVLSNREEVRLVLRWIGILYGQVGCDMAATSGVHDWSDVVKLVLVGANITMVTSALLRGGPSQLTRMVEGLDRWLDDRDYLSVDQARGSLSRRAVPDPGAFERDNYMKALVSFSSDWAAGQP